MAETVVQHFREAEVVVMAAAVSDFAPAEAVPDKLKKREVDPVIRLRMTSDILRELGGKKEDQFLVGFAAESDELHQNASRKLQEKNLNLIVANDISEADKGFQSNYNQVLFLDRRGRSEESPVLHKSEIARLLWDRIEEALSSSEWRSPSADYA
jgi:phosphopantothenoylcysteine decarboxylase/phosphopantothenate--cysteine ligase